MKFYKCYKCGNIVVKPFDKCEGVFCCGEKMTLLTPGSEDAAAEKHVPVVELGDVIKVKVGEVAHPMEDDHWITFIALETAKGVQFAYLNPGDAPEAEFVLAPGDKAVAAYEHCNKHGLWVAEL